MTVTGMCQPRMASIGGGLAVALSVILTAGCGASQPASGSAQSPSQPATRSAVPTPPSQTVAALADRYLAIAVPANKQLDTEVDGFTDKEHEDLAAAEAGLRAEVVTVRAFDKHLGEIQFPGAMAATARALIKVNQERATLIARQARSSSIAGLVSFDSQHHADDAFVEDQVKILRRDLGLPPPSDS